MCLYVSSAGDDAPDSIAEVERCIAIDSAVYFAVSSLERALFDQARLGKLLASGASEQDLDARIAEAERAVFEAFERYNRALCTQARGEPYRLLEASHGGVARSMRFRLAQNRTVAKIEAHAARLVADRARIATEAL